MTERRARLQRKREVRKRNMCKKAFRIVAGFLLIALCEIAAAAFILYCKGSADIRGLELLVIILAGASAAMIFEKV